MSEEIVKIKGGKSGLLLTFAPQADFPDVLALLREKLESGSGFFLRGTLVQIPRDVFTAEEREKLQKLFHEHGLICRPMSSGSEEKKDMAGSTSVSSEPVKQGDVQQAPKQTGDQIQEMMVVNRTLRGGQEIRTKSSVLVCGNVNPGAQIIAGGSIDVRGICRGLVHAGAYGDTTAIIVADRLVPTQIRIAGMIARSPDQGDADDVTQRPERALIRDGQIVIEPIER